MKNLKTKKLTFEQKFIVYTSIALVVFMLIGFLISYLWYLYGGNLKIDSPTLVTIIGISAGIPIAVIGAWAAISIARQSYSIQSRQEALENKISLIEIITPIKNDFNKLAVSMNDLLSQSLAHFELLNHFDEQVMYRELYSQNTENNQSIITTELIESLTKSENILFEHYDGLIASLINIQNNAKSTVFWNWILAKRRKVFENSKISEIKEEYNNVNENVFFRAQFKFTIKH